MAKVLTGSKLSAKETLFVTEYQIDRNQTKAAIRAGYSERTAKTTGYELMKRPRVKAAITKALKAQQERTLITADQVLLDIQSIGNEARRAKDYAQALRSRELIGKRYKLFTDKLEVVDTTPRAERLRAARERKAQATE